MNWNINLEKLPGPERKKWPYLDDREHVSPDGRHLALLFSIAEVGMGWDVGQLAIFNGPPETPSPLLVEREILVMAYAQKAPWLDNTLCVFSAYMWNGKTRAIPILILDIENGSLAFYPVMNSFMSTLTEAGDGWIIKETTRDDRFQSHDGEHIRKQSLLWYPWNKVKKAKRDYWDGVLGTAT